MVGKYKVITLCGSTKFKEQYLETQKLLTLAGNIVISVGLFGHSGDDEVWTEGTKAMLDDMHKRKIDMADEIYVINVGGYIGDSTRSEIQYAEEHGIDYRNSSVKRIIGIGEGLRNQDFSLNLLGSKIKAKWDVDLYATYSSTEMGATFSECQYGVGGHVHPELIIVEIIGEDNLPVPDGEEGEIVVTTLGVEGMPLLRFRTGDIAAKRVEQCRCGRNSYRLTPLVGRKNNMIKLKGTTLYPPAINDVLDNVDYVADYVVYVQDSEAGTDDVVVKVALAHDPGCDVVKDLKDRFRARLRVAPNVEMLPKEEIMKVKFPAQSRKPVKFVDLRNKK